MYEFIKHLTAPPRFDDEDANRIAAFINIILVVLLPATVIISIVDALAGIFVTGIILLPAAITLSLTRRLVFQGRLRQASVLLLATLIVTMTFLLITGQGLHDIGLPLYPVIVLIAALLLDRRDYVVSVLLVIASLAFINLGELFGLFMTKDLYPPRLADLVIISVIIILAAVGLRVMAENLTSSIQRARKNERDLAIANEELRKKAQLMEMSESRWRSVIDNAPVLIFSIVLDGTITFSNQLDQDGIDAYVGRSFFELMPAWERQQARTIVTQVYSTGKPASMESRLLNVSGDWRWHQIQLGPVFNPDGKVNNLIVLAADMHDRKMAVEALRISEENLRQRATQLAALNKIGQSLATLQDIHGALMEVVFQLKEILPLDVFFVSLYDLEKDIVSYPIFYENSHFTNEASSALDREGWVAMVIDTRQPFLLHRTAEELRQLKEDAQKYSAYMLGDRSKVSASVLIVPLAIGQKVIGAVSVHSYQRDAFVDEHVSLLTSVANQIAIAIENARLYEALLASEQATSRRAEQLVTLLEIGTALSTLQDLQGALTLTFAQIKRIIPLDVFYVGLHDEERDMVTFPIYYEAGKMWDEQPSPIVETSWAMEVIKSGSPFIFYLTEEELAQQKKKHENKTAIGISASVMMVPLRIGTKIIGVISTHSYKLHAYNDELLTLLTAVGNQVAIAVENARLYDALHKELSERRRAEQEVRDLNDELENRVRQRTIELETANRELESYSYTVSHDLRAPLRAIHGFSRILANDFLHELSPSARTYLKRITDNATQMGNLIDDLLAFSRLGRKPIAREPVSLDAVVQSVISELTQHEEDLSRFQFVLGNLGVAQADPGLIKQVFVNLISNAIKFSRANDIARIEVGCTMDGDSVIYFVKDNGAGFDMAYAGKLFQVFTRLHSYEEFEGTGVGLAIVQRIIEKHGGRVWAKSQMGKGAEFFFTLGDAG